MWRQHQATPPPSLRRTSQLQGPGKGAPEKKRGRERNGPPENGLEERLQLCQSMDQTSMRSNSPSGSRPLPITHTEAPRQESLMTRALVMLTQVIGREETTRKAAAAATTSRDRGSVPSLRGCVQHPLFRASFTQFRDASHPTSAESETTEERVFHCTQIMGYLWRSAVSNYLGAFT